MNEKEKALSEIIGNMTPEQLQRGAEIYDMLVQAMKDDETYRAMSNEELAKELLNVWGEIPVFSKHSNLLDEIIMRLGGVRGEQFCPNCEAETPCTHEAELFVCDICGEDFAKYIVSRNCSVSDVSMTQDVLTDVKTGKSVEIETCSWIQEDDPEICYWKTRCGNSFYFTEGTPADNRMKYCCYCGKLLKQED